MILAIDFDDTIHDTKNRQRGFKLGKPVPGAKAAINACFLAGDTIIIHTIWGGETKMKIAIADWLDYFDIRFHTITNIKPKADYYIDDKAIRFTSWRDVVEHLDA